MKNPILSSQSKKHKTNPIPQEESLLKLGQELFGSLKQTGRRPTGRRPTGRRPKASSTVSVGQTLKEHQTNLFSKKEWYGKLMRWTLSSPSFKTPLFRFVDVFPVLKNQQDIFFFLNEYLGSQAGGSAPWALKHTISFLYMLNQKMPAIPLLKKSQPFITNLVCKQMKAMSSLFIVGEDFDSAWPILKQMQKNGFGWTLDLLGEAVLSSEEAQFYQNRYWQIIDQLSPEVKQKEPNEHKASPAMRAGLSNGAGLAITAEMDKDETGDLIPQANISVKVSSLDSQIQNVSWDFSKERLKKKLRVLFQKAVDKGVFINIDMEQYVYKDMTLSVWTELIMEKEFKNYPHFGIVIQAYLKDSLRDLQKLLTLVKVRGVAITVRLVKGAYWDYELIHSRQNMWPCPVYENKWESDMNFEICTNFILKAYPFLRLALGTHNLRSLTYALQRSQELKIPKKALEIQTLYGMAMAINSCLIQKGWRVRQYCPLGVAIPGMAYLVRRLLENTANESFIQNHQTTKQSIAYQLKALTPVGVSQPSLSSGDQTKGVSQNSKNKNQIASSFTLGNSKEYVFQNTPLLDFSISVHRQKFQKALEKWKSRLPLRVPVVIDNQEQYTAHTFKRENPSYPSEKVVVVSQADKSLCTKAIQSAKKSFISYSQTSAKKRCQMLMSLADKIEANRYSLAALQVLEVGKSWAGADGDVCEAIDFCRYYSKEMGRLSKSHSTAKVLGEESFYSYHPRGVALVIAPWNFPLAILTGMTVASLVTGNTVLIKPAEQSSATAYELMKLLIECGYPLGTVQFLPGIGEETGAFLVEQTETELIAFTGSKETGTAILEKANQVFSRKNKLKRCVVEMGGKNAIIVDESADLDIAVAGVVESAFGFQGQKCSACSRVIVAKSIEKLFAERLLQAIQSWTIGPAEKPESRLGPVVDFLAFQKVQSYIEQGKKIACLISKEGRVPAEGYFISPAVFNKVPNNSPLLKEEIFGPVLVLIPFEDLDQAIQVANKTEFALTAGFYSRSPSRIKKAKQSLLAGNIYINRACTGALVERHPFGGFKMSGLGPKAGGPDYLIQFMNSKVVTENTVRRGFSPHLLNNSSANKEQTKSKQ